ncbi:hypothetical protein CTI12_AA364380 [Artemisia annua]|uniref:Peroxin-13 n=1 Tax=Artemisia annua TaxID=35608 RepID=A0A2U1MLW8_ARTAN|nr:hypothetical protein CTI12_AA364380 [Artemisia annua]
MAANNSGSGAPPKPWERAGSSSGPAPFKPASAGSTSDVVEASGTARPGEIVPPNDTTSAVNRNTLGRPVPSRPWEQQQTYGGAGYGSGLGYNSTYGTGGYGSYGGIGSTYNSGGLYGNSMYNRGGYGGGLYGSGGVGWEGLAHDTRVFLRAINNPSMNFPKLPEGKYCLVDKGYLDKKGYLVPYPKIRYHTSQFENEPPNNMQEAFNRSHSSLRSAIE